MEESFYTFFAGLLTRYDPDHKAHNKHDKHKDSHDAKSKGAGDDKNDNKKTSKNSPKPQLKSSEGTQKDKMIKSDEAKVDYTDDVRFLLWERQGINNLQKHLLVKSRYWLELH